MIQQRIGDLLHIEERGKHFYIVVLTRVVMFGGNVVFAFHNEGEERTLDHLSFDSDGFNVCTDLLRPKREGCIKRMHRFDDLSPFWRTRYAKGCHEHRRGVKALSWYIYNINDIGGTHVARVSQLTREYMEAMDYSCISFDLVAQKVLARYTPAQNEHI